MRNPSHAKKISHISKGGSVPSCGGKPAGISPEHETLHDEVVLTFMTVAQPCTFSPHTYIERIARLVFRGLEVVLHVVDDTFYGVTVEQQEGIVVGYAVQAVQDLLLRQVPGAIPAEMGYGIESYASFPFLPDCVSQ